MDSPVNRWWTNTVGIIPECRDPKQKNWSLSGDGALYPQMPCLISILRRLFALIGIADLTINSSMPSALAKRRFVADCLFSAREPCDTVNKHTSQSTRAAQSTSLLDPLEQCMVVKSSICRQYVVYNIAFPPCARPSQVLPSLPLCLHTLGPYPQPTDKPPAPPLLPRSGFSTSRLPLRLLLLPGRPYLISPPIDHLPAHAHLPYRGFFEHI